MKAVRAQLAELFRALDARIQEINGERREEGLSPLARAKVQLLGQLSLLADESASLMLALAQTADMDALLSMDHVVKVELQKLLRSHGYIYDEDSPLIWIPPGSEFVGFLRLESVDVESIDPESALVSKAVKDPAKNKQLIRQAIASNRFPALVDRILGNGGKLENFI